VPEYWATLLEMLPPLSGVLLQALPGSALDSAQMVGFQEVSSMEGDTAIILSVEEGEGQVYRGYQDQREMDVVKNGRTQIQVSRGKFLDDRTKISRRFWGIRKVAVIR
jgi:hypothetical protein